jgi:O-antigen ligase
MIWLFLGLSTVFILNGYLARWGILSDYYFILAVGMIPSWAVALGLSMALINTDIGIHWRVLLLILAVNWFVLGITGIAALASAWVPPLVAIMMIFFVYSKRFFLIVLVIGLILVILMPQFVQSLLAQGTSEGVVDYRTNQWFKVIEISKASPIIGLGPASYRSYIFSSISTRPELFQGIPDYAWDSPSHNQYVDLVAQSGILGLLAYLWLMGTILFNSWKTYQRTEDCFARAYSLALIGGGTAALVIGVIGDWILPYVYNIGVNGFRQSVFTWIFFGGLIVISSSRDG